MTGQRFSYSCADLTVRRLGLIALQSDETIERDFRKLLPDDAELMVSRVPSSKEVSSDTLAAMEVELASAAALFPAPVTFDALGYGCTSATAQIGADQVAARIREGTHAQAVTQPVSALIAACNLLKLKKLALLSPYVEPVSARLREALLALGVETPVFGSFNVSDEATVVRIDAHSVEQAARSLMHKAEVDGLFLSCTNLRVLEVIEPLEAELGVPVLSSNQVLAWHMTQLAGLAPPATAPGQLFAAQRK